MPDNKLSKKDIEYWKRYYAKTHKVMQPEIDRLEDLRRDIKKEESEKTKK